MNARAALLLALMGAISCRSVVLVSKCTSDDECPANWHCATQGPRAGDCLCNGNEACPSDGGVQEFCNPSGSCQVRVGCVTNADCSGLEYCDTAGECVTGTGCTSDVDCVIGKVCDRTQGGCVPGCHSNGDCPRNVACVCSNGRECQCPSEDAGFVDPAGFDRSTCEVGECRIDTCAGDTSLCPYNQDCASQPDGGLSVCEPDPRMNVLCQGCTIQAGTISECPGSPGANFCLIDLHGGNLFCGVDCSQGQGCPSGYDCDDVIVLTQSICTSDSQCASSQLACTPGGANNGGCPPDTQCVGSAGSAHCTGFCVGEEGNGQGYCTCVTDADCPQDNCETNGACRISQQPCSVTANGDATCRSYINCVDNGGARGCFIGRNCAPGHGLHCPINVSQ